MPLYFHSEGISFTIKNKKTCRLWVEDVIKSHRKTIGSINIIFTTNPLLLIINKQYLNHNYYTDVITFNYNEPGIVSGDIYISVDQVRENSKDLRVTFESEILRVIIHGVLHLLGYNDKSEVEIMEMRKKENEALEMLEGLSNGKNL